jgi:hypothetical protein
MRRLNVTWLLIVLFHLFLNAVSSKLNFYGKMTNPADEIPVRGPASACRSCGLELVYFLCCLRLVYLVLKGYVKAEVKSSLKIYSSHIFQDTGLKFVF